jgi:hypothetical protein
MSSNHRDKVLGELGVLWVTYALTCAGWHAYRKINEKGFDLLIERNNKRLLVEVKSRDPLSCKGKNRSYVTVGGSPIQNEVAQYLAIYVHGFATTIILPTAHPLVASVKARNSLRIATIKDGKLVVRNEFSDYENSFNLR